MSRADGIIRKLDAALTKLAPPIRIVYKRLITRTGGDDLIGRGVAIAYTDTKMVPQPFYARLTYQVVGDKSTAEMLTEGSSANVADNYLILLSPTAISVPELENPDLEFLMKDPSGDTEVFRLTDYEPIGLSAQTVVYVGYIRSTERP